MQGMGAGDDSCPFSFNFDPDSFKPGDTVSYRVSGSLSGFPFVGRLIEVGGDYVVIQGTPDNPDEVYRGTRESRPLVDYAQITI